jgi:ribosomal protein L40E
MTAVWHDDNGLIRAEASVTLQKIPRCPKCYAGNPQQLSSCPICGTPAPDLPDPVMVADVAATLPRSMVPWYATALLAFGNWLRDVAKGISP